MTVHGSVEWAMFCEKKHKEGKANSEFRLTNCMFESKTIGLQKHFEFRQSGVLQKMLYTLALQCLLKGYFQVPL